MQNLKFGSIFGNLFQKGTLAIFPSLYTIKTMINSCHCVSCLGLVCIMDLKYCMSKMYFQNVGKQYVIYLTHTLINSYIVHFSRADAPIIGHMLEYCSNVEHTSDTYNEDGHCRGEATAKVLPQRMKWEIPEPVRIKYRLLYLN